MSVEMNAADIARGGVEGLGRRYIIKLYSSSIHGSKAN